MVHPWYTKMHEERFGLHILGGLKMCVTLKMLRSSTYVMVVILLLQLGFTYCQWQESGIHHTMYDLYHSPGWVSDGCCKKAKRILDKLTPMLLNDVRNRKWSYQGIHSICYISNDHCMTFVSPLWSDVCWVDASFFLGIWDLPEDEILMWMIYGHRFYANKYWMGMIGYYIHCNLTSSTCKAKQFAEISDKRNN